MAASRRQQSPETKRQWRALGMRPPKILCPGTSAVFCGVQLIYDLQRMQIEARRPLHSLACRQQPLNERHVRAARCQAGPRANGRGSYCLPDHRSARNRRSACHHLSAAHSAPPYMHAGDRRQCLIPGAWWAVAAAAATTETAAATTAVATAATTTVAATTATVAATATAVAAAAKLLARVAAAEAGPTAPALAAAAVARPRGEVLQPACGRAQQQQYGCVHVRVRTTLDSVRAHFDTYQCQHTWRKGPQTNAPHQHPKTKRLVHPQVSACVPQPTHLGQTCHPPALLCNPSTLTRHVLVGFREQLHKATSQGCIGVRKEAGRQTLLTCKGRGVGGWSAPEEIQGDTGYQKVL